MLYDGSPERRLAFIMPIKLIRAIAARMKGDESAEKQARTPSRSRPSPKNTTPSLASKAGEVWRPGSFPAEKKSPSAPERKERRPRSTPAHPAGAKPGPANSDSPEASDGDAPPRKRRRSRGGRGRKRPAGSGEPNVEAGQSAATATVADRQSQPKADVASSWSPADYVVEPVEGKLRFQDVGFRMKFCMRYMIWDSSIAHRFKRAY